MSGPSLPPNQSTGTETTQTPEYQPRFTRSKWTHAGEAFDRFFDSFVPRQYDQGFGWRCQVLNKIDPREGARFKDFESIPNEHKGIAANAEVLLVMFEGISPSLLDRMRASGRQIAAQGVVNPKAEIEGDMPEVREEMNRVHHAAWYEKFKADLASGARTDANHRGGRPYDELPEIELLISKFQTLGNWRILGCLSDEEYSMLRGLAVKRAASGA